MNNSPVTHHKPSHHRYARFLKWRRLHVTDSGFILLLALVVGILSGVCAWLLKYLISLITSLAKTGVNTTGSEWLIIFVPTAGITLTALFCRYVLHEKVDNGVARMVSDLKRHDYKLSAKTIYGSMIASSLTLGFGGTAGSEGPIAYAGAGIGSKLGQIFHVKPQMLMILIGCGAAAGIAGIFKAPIGGALFAIEVLRVELSTVAVMGVFLATLAASLVAYTLSGCTLDINVISPGAFDNSTMVWAVLLGVICGIYSLYYTHTGELTKRMLASARQPWLQWIASGLTIGLMIYAFPALYGEGYDSITNVINNHPEYITRQGNLPGLFLDMPWLLMATCIGILLLKGTGASSTNNGGGVAGDFAPTLFAGCILGLLYASALDLWGIAHLNAAHYALIAMAGSMAGIIRAPLMSIFLTTEMVGGVEFLLPAAIVALISYSMVMIIKRDTFYHSRPFTSPELRP